MSARMGAKARLEAFKAGRWPYGPPAPGQLTPAQRSGLRSPEREAWNSMIQRCHNPNNVGYRNYGGRGIAVCEEWRCKEHGFSRFLAHVGPKPFAEYSLDRIDNSRGYEPGNVRWTDIETQNRNRRPWSHRPEAWIDFGTHKMSRRFLAKIEAEREAVRKLAEEESGT